VSILDCAVYQSLDVIEHNGKTYQRCFPLFHTICQSCESIKQDHSEFVSKHDLKLLDPAIFFAEKEKWNPSFASSFLQILVIPQEFSGDLVKTFDFLRKILTIGINDRILHALVDACLLKPVNLNA
jgi:hypothetical protein